MSFISCLWVLVISVFHISGSAVAQPKYSQEIVAREYNKDESKYLSAARRAVTVLLRDAKGDQLGSGVLIARARNGNWIATSQHVIANQKVICVDTVYHQSIIALVSSNWKSNRSQNIDLALVFIPGNMKDLPLLATMKEELNSLREFPLVVATGFPAMLSKQPDIIKYTEYPGLLLPLLPSPLQDGLDMTYTSNLEKGMSGGGVFIGNQLIGINSAHKYPLWQSQRRDEQGRVLDDELNKKLNLVSLGVSVKQIKKAVEFAKLPSSVNLNSLQKFKCNTAVKTPKTATKL